MSSKKKNLQSDFKILKWLFTVCKGQIPTLIVVVALNAVYGATAVFFARFSKSIIDGATEIKDMSVVAKYALALLLLVLFQLVLNVLKNSLMERCSAKIEMILKRYLLDLIIKKDYMSVTGYHTGDLQNRMFNDVRIIADGFSSIIPQTVFLGAKLFSSLIYLVCINKIFAAVFLIGGCVVFLITQTFRVTIKRLHKRVQETEGKTRSFIQEVLTNLLVIKAFAVEDKINERTDELQENNFKARMKRRNFSIVANCGLNAVFNIGTVFAVVFGAWSVLNAGMSFGDVIAITQLVGQIQSPFATLSGIMPKYYSLLASSERLMEISALADEQTVNSSELDRDEIYRNLKAISFENINFKYDRDIILNDTSLSIKKGDFVAIMGISGIGKSTLLKLLMGVFRLQGGEIKLKTSDGDIPVDKNTRPLFSYVPQGNMLISGTIRENLTFVNDKATDEEIKNAIRISCANQFIDELPDGIDTIIGEKGLGLSEGQVQRLAIARSILTKAPVLLLDEATSALDEDTEKQFLTNLKELENVSCIIVSHKRAALEICNKHIQIIDGKIVEG